MQRVQDGVQDGDMDRVDIAEAARRLDTTPEAIRKRIRRGTLPAGKQDGRWWVLVDASRTNDEPGRTPGRTDGTVDGVQDAGQDASRTELLGALREEIVWLRAELERRSVEIERRDVIIAQLTQAIPRLEAPASTDAQNTAERASQRASARPWWAFWRRAVQASSVPR